MEKSKRLGRKLTELWLVRTWSGEPLLSRYTRPSCTRRRHRLSTDLGSSSSGQLNILVEVAVEEISIDGGLSSSRREGHSFLSHFPLHKLFNHMIRFLKTKIQREPLKNKTIKKFLMIERLLLNYCVGFCLARSFFKQTKSWVAWCFTDYLEKNFQTFV